METSLKLKTFVFVIVQAWNSSTWWAEAEDQEIKREGGNPLQYSHKYKVSLIRESE